MSQLFNTKRVAIISGLRTPFVQAGTKFKNLSATELGRLTVVELLNRTEIDSGVIDGIIFGSVLPVGSTLNPSRDIALGAGLRSSASAFNVSGVPASLNQAFTDAASHILLGDAQAVVCGGAESVSAYLDSSQGMLKNFRGKNRTLPAEEIEYEVPWLSGHTGGLSDSTSGKSSGYIAEKASRVYGISRDEQDEFAARSYSLAAKAREEGLFDNEIIDIYVPPQFEDIVSEDKPVSGPMDMESLSKLPTPYDENYGTVTYGTRAPLSDGASAMLLMSEDRARTLGLRPLGYLKSYAYAAADPAREPLMGPSYSTPLALRRASITLSDIDLLEWHEAFSVQVLANLRALESGVFAQGSSVGDFTRGGNVLGKVDMDILNLSGGAISIGDAMAASSSRQIISILLRLERRDKNLGLVSIGDPGGQGATFVLERN